MPKLSRRDFIKLSALGLGSAVLSACGPHEVITSTSITPTSAPTPNAPTLPSLTSASAPSVPILPTQASAPASSLPVSGVINTLNHPDFLGSEILTRPTRQSATVNVIPAKSMEAFFEYGPTAGSYTAQTAPMSSTAGVPIQAVIKGLAPNTRYHYRLRYRSSSSDFAAGQEHSFVTQRSRGSAFTFAVQADSHLGTPQHNDPALYARTIQNAAKDQPDFYIDLGDTFRATKLKSVNRDTVTQLYLSQRPFFGMICDSAPLFLVNGNHEMEWGWLVNATAPNAATLCALARKRYYPQPTPDDFYSGNAQPLESIGLPEDYYAWEWGDALFIVIDPYWHTPKDPGGVGDDKITGQDSARDPWTWTLGDAQYQWFKQTLEQSTARYKFVFHHHILGATRGGIEWVDLYEWGGKERRGSNTFAQNRPTWAMPIHPLMVKHGVTIFFQGHDHIFVRQQRDGITYQTVPMCGEPQYRFYNRDAYTSGDILPNTGHLRIQVSPNSVKVDYIRSYLERPAELAFSYTV